MDSMNLNINNVYSKATQVQNSNAYEKVAQHNKIHNPLDGHKNHDATNSESNIHNSAVNVSISMESLKVFLNIKSIELSQNNASAQNFLSNIVNNTEVYDFLSGKEIEGGFSLASIGYEGKPITQLNADEAKELVSESGFFWN